MKQFLGLFFWTYYNSNYLSFKLRKIIEKINIRKVIGLQLSCAMLAAGVIVPQANSLVSKVYAEQLTEKTDVSQNTQTQVTFKWPLASYQISQYYRFFHPALDLTTNYDNPVLAIADGTIENTEISAFGYGRNILVRHNNGYFSLYAHLSKIIAKTGDNITQGQIIGTAGSSGWSTGTHLHLEIRGPEGTVDPLEVLPTTESPKTP